MWHELQLFLIALQLATRLALAGAQADSADWQARSLRHLPAVGLVVGAFAALVLFAAAHAWPALVSLLLSLGATLWFTRGSAEMGLARCADAWVCDATPPQRGFAASALPSSAGGTVLVLALALKVAALQALAARDLAAVLATLPLAQAWSRVGVVVLMRALPLRGAGAQAAAPPAAPQSISVARPWVPVDSLGLAVVLMWAGVAAGGAAVSVPAPALMLSAFMAAAVIFLMARWQWRRFGGCIGDGLGATQQVSELAVYLAVLAALSWG
jgi:adenosylcobinamide-GDP ribazoletransferase